MSENYKTGVGVWIQIVIGVVIGLVIVALRGHTFMRPDELDE